MIEYEVAGVEQAAERYGRPERRCCTLPVSEDALAYWQRVRTTRSAEVVLALRRPGGRYLLHTKAFYPAGSYRLLTGGIHPGEDLLEATLREAREETGREARIERFAGILRYRFVHEGQEVSFTSFVFILTLEDGDLHAQDEGENITGYREVPLEELGAIADELEALEPDWIEWGRFRAVAHRFLLEAMTRDDE
jgi:8-oxo-dGTP pyrophosphatase MutT (NUDIX family)